MLEQLLQGEIDRRQKAVEAATRGEISMDEFAAAAPRVGYVPGVFDMFHVGHLNILRNARLACDRLIAGVVSDERARAVKGALPVVSELERIEIVRAVRYVDDAVLEDVDEKLEMWDRLRFDVIVKGDDWRGTAKGDKLERDFASVGVEVVYLPYTLHTSSSLLRKVLNDRLAEA